MFTPLLPEVVPDTDANHAGFYGGVWSVTFTACLESLLNTQNTENLLIVWNRKAERFSTSGGSLPGP